MGSRTDEAQRRVVEQRERIQRHVSGLERRVRDDADEVRERARGRVSYAADKVPGKDPVVDMFHDRPLTSFFGAFGAGIALGIASESLPMGGGDGRDSHDDRSRDRRRSGRDSRGSSGSSALDRLLGPMVASVASPVQDEVRNMVRDVFDSFSSGRERSNGRDNGYARSNGHRTEGSDTASDRSGDDRERGGDRPSTEEAHARAHEGATPWGAEEKR